jgi:Fic family protein
MTNQFRSDHTPKEIENGFRQFDLSVEIAQWYFNPERPFALRLHHILDLQKEAVDEIESEAGQLRSGSVGISKSKHIPPEPYLVKNLMTELCDFINDNWHEKTAFYLSAYVMWKLNWIHPFTDGNGRTARTVSYMLLCLKLGYVLPGSPTVLQHLEEDRSHYIESVRKVH